jgi:hypothetical protein
MAAIVIVLVVQIVESQIAAAQSHEYGIVADDGSAYPRCS